MRVTGLGVADIQADSFEAVDFLGPANQAVFATVAEWVGPWKKKRLGTDRVD